MVWIGRRYEKFYIIIVSLFNIAESYKRNRSTCGNYQEVVIDKTALSKTRW